MKDILDGLNNLFDSVYNSVTGARHDSGDPLLDQAWQELDGYLSSSKPGNQAAFRDMDREFAEFDRRFAANTTADFEALKNRARAESAAKPGSASSGSGQAKPEREDPLLTMARELVRDYHNLEVKPGAKVDEVKAAYKKMIKQYHPDRFANDPEKQKTATTITSKLNQSYHRIMEHLGER